MQPKKGKGGPLTTQPVRTTRVRRPTQLRGELWGGTREMDEIIEHGRGRPRAVALRKCWRWERETSIFLPKTAVKSSFMESELKLCFSTADTSLPTLQVSDEIQTAMSGTFKGLHLVNFMVLFAAISKLLIQNLNCDFLQKLFILFFSGLTKRRCIVTSKKRETHPNLHKT